MLSRICLSLVCFSLLFSTPESKSFSRGKQKKLFPDELKDTNVYLGMSLEKFTKERPDAVVDTVSSFFKIRYTKQIDNSQVEKITYLLTPSDDSRLYAIEIAYSSMEDVQSSAVKVMGKPNYQGEWRFEAKTIKEDFTMGAWTFGHKLVYGATLKNSEWEKGFPN